MKKVYALCLLTLAAVAVDVFLFHAPIVDAQSQSAIGRVTIQYVYPFGGGDSKGVNVTDKKFLGFSCVAEGPATAGHPVCFVASSN